MIPLLHHLYNALAWTWGGYRFRSGDAGYNIMSGPLPDLTLVAGVLAILRTHYCFVPGCHSFRAHPHPEHGHPVCPRHFDQHPRDHA